MRSVTRVAAVDCGTNSIRLLVADVDVEASRLVDVERRMEIVRLGQGVDRTGRFAPEALARTFQACDSYAAAIRAAGAEHLRFVATSASRDVANRDEFVAGVRARLGVDPEVVTGDEEARLSFHGATKELGSADLRRPYLVVDIGGGSTEFVLGDDDGDSVRAARSVDIGCVRLTERHLHSDPPTQDEVAAAEADADRAVSEAATAVPLSETGTLVGLAGSVTTVTAKALDLPAYDPARIHRASISATAVHEVARQLLRMTRDQRAALPFMHPGRVDVIGAGALILSVIVSSLPVDAVLASEHDILDGICWQLAELT